MTYSPTERDKFGYPHQICDRCETVAHCSLNGCVPETVYAPMRVNVIPLTDAQRAMLSCPNVTSIPGADFPITLECDEPMSDFTKAAVIVGIGLVLGIVGAIAIMELLP